MKISIKHLLFILILIFTGCKVIPENPFPATSVRTPVFNIGTGTTIENVTETSFKVSSSLLESGGADVSQHGHVWSDSKTEPTTADSKTEQGRSQGPFPLQFNSDVKNLKPATNYYVRAYAINEKGTSYSTTVQVKTNSITLPDDKAEMDISAGGGHSLVLKADNTLWGSGLNLSGQLGDGTYVNKKTYSKVADNVKAVNAGLVYTLIIKKDNTLWAVGSNHARQFGISTLSDINTFSKVTDNVKAVSAGGVHILVLKTDNTLWACGINKDGELGTGNNTDRSILTKVADNVKAISAGGYHSLVIKTDNSLWACGKNEYGQLGDGTNISKNVLTKITDNVRSASAGENFSLVVKTDNSLWAWGLNSHGQLGDGSTTDKNSPKKVAEDVKEVSGAAGGSFTLIIKTDNSLWACGRNTSGQLGNGNTNPFDAFQSIFTKIRNDVKIVRAGVSHSVILTAKNELLSCGNNMYGQLGDGSTESKSTLTAISLP